MRLAQLARTSLVVVLVAAACVAPTEYGANENAAKGLENAAEKAKKGLDRARENGGGPATGPLAPPPPSPLIPLEATPSELTFTKRMPPGPVKLRNLNNVPVTVSIPESITLYNDGIGGDGEQQQARVVISSNCGPELAAADDPSGTGMVCDFTLSLVSGNFLATVTGVLVITSSAGLTEIPLTLVAP